MSATTLSSEVLAFLKRLGHGQETAPVRLSFGSWLSNVRQADDDFFSAPRRASRKFSFRESRGDLTRTHIVRLKRERAGLDDAVTRRMGPY
jgi:hypothetical protein